MIIQSKVLPDVIEQPIRNVEVPPTLRKAYGLEVQRSVQLQAVVDGRFSQGRRRSNHHERRRLLLA